MVRALIPPLTIVLAVVTALALILTAAAITPPPLPSEPAPPPLTMPTPSAVTTVAITPLAHSEEIEIPPAPVAIGLARLTYRPGASGPTWRLPGPLLLVVESGTLAAALERPGHLVRGHGTAERAAGALLLHPGDALAVSAATPADFHSADTTPAVVLAVGVFPADGAGTNGSVLTANLGRVWSPAAKVTLLAGAKETTHLKSPAQISLSRVLLAPGERLPLATTGTRLLAVDAGALTLRAERGLVSVEHPGDRDVSLSRGATATLLTGDGAILQHTASATLRNDGSGPLQLLVLTVDPSGAV
jgi:quercetin dioxygenase-like cupin family protein